MTYEQSLKERQTALRAQYAREGPKQWLVAELEWIAGKLDQMRASSIEADGTKTK